MAIIPFENKSGKEKMYGDVSDILIDKVSSNILNNKSSKEFLEIISKDKLEEALKKGKLTLTPVIDNTTAINLGRILGAHEVIIGKFVQLGFSTQGPLSTQNREAANIQVGTEKYYN